MTKKHLLIALKVAVSGGLVWFLLSSVDIGAAKTRIFAADPLMIGLAGVVMVFQTGVGGARWWAVMRAIGHPLDWIELTRLFWIGGFFSQALPSSVGGDPIRIYMAYKDGLPLGKSINGVMLERVVTIIGLVVLVAAVQPAFLPKLDEHARALTLAGLGALAAGAVFGVVLLMFLDRLPEVLSKYRIVRGLHDLAGDTRKLFLHPMNALLSLFFGILTHVNISLCVYLLGISLAVDVTWLDCLVLMPPVILVMTVPISIAGWGVREGAMVASFGLVGVPHEGALVMSLAFGVLAVVVMLPGGLLWLLGRKSGGAVSMAEAAEAVEEEMDHAAEMPEPRA